MLRHKPKLTYSGLTIVLSNPSRFDTIKLLSAGGGRIIDDFLQPDINRFQCDIRLKEDVSPLEPNTRCILVLGESAARIWCKETDNNLGAIRGSVYYYDGRFTGSDMRIPMIASFFPQDAADIKNYEADHNTIGGDEVSISESESDDEESGDEKSRHGRTKRKNYRFWIQQDIKRCKTILKTGVPESPIQPNYIIHPPSNEIIQCCNDTKDQEMFLDIETGGFGPLIHIRCISISFSKNSTVYCIPWLSHDYSWAYSNLPSVVKAIAIGIHQNIAVAHNGSAFDFPVLAWRYRIPIGKRVADTMIMHHRCFSDTEKSLGHSTSMWTWEPFHKDEGDVGYNTPSQVEQTLRYCGKDVYTMKLIYYSILEYASKIPGLTNSINKANASIRPFLTTTLQGILFDDEKRKEIIQENDTLCMQYLRLLNILVGKHNLIAIAGKSKKPMPSSNKQCVTYFHDMLGYPVVGRGEVKQDGTRGPSLGKKNMLKLKLKFDNPVIDLCLAYRELIRETGSLNFTPWNPDYDFLRSNIPQQLGLTSTV